MGPEPATHASGQRVDNKTPHVMAVAGIGGPRVAQPGYQPPALSHCRAPCLATNVPSQPIGSPRVPDQALGRGEPILRNPQPNCGAIRATSRLVRASAAPAACASGQLSSGPGAGAGGVSPSGTSAAASSASGTAPSISASSCSAVGAGTMLTTP